MSIKLWIIEDDSNYTASCIVLPELKPVAWLDNLMFVTVFGYWCIVGKDSIAGKYIFFPAETVLSKEFLSENNLYRHENLNKDSTKKWFFWDDGRVKAIKFKWVVSSWFIMPISCLTYLWYESESYSELRIGDEFHSINGRSICSKYRRPISAMRLNWDWVVWKRKSFDIIIPTQFRFHTSTPQFLKFLWDFTEWDMVTVTEKLHGTSAVFSNTLTTRKLWFIEKLARAMWVWVQEVQYRPIYSSRTLIKNSNVNLSQDGGYYWEDIWWKYAAKLDWKIEKGITLYWEIVGYTSAWAFIQKGYHYGCKQGESKFYCYRMTYTTTDGNVIEFTDSQIRQYCKIREIDVVPLIEMTSVSDGWIKSRLTALEHFSDYIKYKYLTNIEVMCPMNEGKVPREWVVIRRDWQESYSAYKLKSQLFLAHETKEIDNGTEDLESI